MCQATYYPSLPYVLVLISTFQASPCVHFEISYFYSN